MDIREDFARALRETEIHRQRRSRLLTVGTTELPYVLLGESLVNLGDTVVRSGVVRVEQPSIFLLNRPLQFDGFDDEEGVDGDVMLALGRMASFPPGKYSNIDARLDVFEGRIDAALRSWRDRLESLEDQGTGLLSGPVDVWPLSLLVYVGSVIRTSAPADLKEILKRQLPPPSWQ